MPTTYPTDLVPTARRAGLLYLAIILLGLTSEVALRGSLVVAGDAGATLGAVVARPWALRASILADTGMMLADIGLALLLFRILAPVDRALALAAMVLRLMQAAVIGASLVALLGVLALLEAGTREAGAVLALFETHAAGYDLGLVFFGVNTLLTAHLLGRSGLVPRWLPPLLMAAGAVYLAGSTARIVDPALQALIEPAYLVPVVAETAFAVILLMGFGWRAQAG